MGLILTDHLTLCHGLLFDVLESRSLVFCVPRLVTLQNELAELMAPSHSESERGPALDDVRKQQQQVGIFHSVKNVGLIIIGGLLMSYVLRAAQLF